MTTNCLSDTPQKSNVFDGTAYFAARHLPPKSRVYVSRLPHLTGTVHSAQGLERTVVLDPLMTDDDVPPVPSWLPHTRSSFPVDPALTKVFSVKKLQRLY